MNHHEMYFINLIEDRHSFKVILTFTIMAAEDF